MDPHELHDKPDCRLAATGFSLTGRISAGQAAAEADEVSVGAGPLW